MSILKFGRTSPSAKPKHAYSGDHPQKIGLNLGLAREEVNLPQIPAHPERDGDLEHHLQLYPVWSGGKSGYVYNVTLGDDLIVERSSDPECDTARALQARGITDKVTIYDGNTAEPRTTINIERAAKLITTEGRGTVHFEKVRQTIDSAPDSHEEPEVVLTLPPDEMEAACRVKRIRRPVEQLDNPLVRHRNGVPLAIEITPSPEIERHRAVAAWLREDRQKKLVALFEAWTSHEQHHRHRIQASVFAGAGRSSYPRGRELHA
jgi:hypothetical protein